jgi:hypothetical protein
MLGVALRPRPVPWLLVSSSAAPEWSLISETTQVWASPALLRARHDAGAAREHAIPQSLASAGVTAFADSAYCGAGTTIKAPYRRTRYDKTTRKFTRTELSAGQKAANQAHSAIQAPGGRANAELKNWRILRKIRSSSHPHHHPHQCNPDTDA